MWGRSWHPPTHYLLPFPFLILPLFLTSLHLISQRNQLSSPASFLKLVRTSAHILGNLHLTDLEVLDRRKT